MATRRAISGELLSRCMGDPDAVFQRLAALKKEGEHVVAELERFNREHPVAMPSARAGQPAARAGSRLVDTVTIAIAALIAAYFLAQMVRAVLS